MPINSDNHKEFQTLFEVIGQRLDSQGWIQLFTLWTLTVSGIVLTMDLGDRYTYWEWGGWSTGLAKLGITTIFFNFVLRPRRMWSLGDKVLSNKELASHVFIGLGLIGFGWFDPHRMRRPRPSVWFCSMPCQSFWTRLARERFAMVDLTEEDLRELRARHGAVDAHHLASHWRDGPRRHLSTGNVVRGN